MRRSLAAAILIALASSAPATRAEPCPLDAHAPTPMASRRGSTRADDAATRVVKAMRVLLDEPAWRRAPLPLEAVMALVSATRDAPWHVPARAALVQILDEPPDVLDRPACAASRARWIVGLVGAALAAAEAGCDACFEVVRTWVERGASSWASEPLEGADLVGLRAQVAAGPVGTHGSYGSLVDAARAVLDWLFDDVEGGRARGAAHIDAAAKIVVPGATITGRDGLERWWRSGPPDAPGERWLGVWRRPAAWTCAGVCCRFQALHAHRPAVTRMCFDRERRLRELVIAPLVP